MKEKKTEYNIVTPNLSLQPSTSPITLELS